jgi:serine/threonine-protein kinase
VNPERWARVVALFEAALAVPEEARARFVADSAGDDDRLRRQVESMLAADGAREAILDDGAEPLARALGAESESAADDPSSFAGRRVGPYRIIDHLGRGGMGSVYRARRDDVGMDVALKVVAGALAAPERVRRFEAERRVLARLEHRAIARLLDAGVLDDGTPWFAMELVDGAAIDRHCDERGLGVAARLALFDEVCAAVEYAHRHLVVHRDLKPANILVTAPGKPKLLDFGVAKSLDEHQEDAASLTRAGGRVMTPEFAAPEQIRGDPVTTASDVYALGVLLYRLLTGQLPRTVSALTTAAAERQLREAHVAAPSAIQGDGPLRALGPDRRRELDALVLRALEVEPARRYASAEQLRADLAAFRDHRPLAARVPTRRYRLAKFVRRNRGYVAAATGVAALLAVFVATLSTERAATARERDRAILEAATAEQVGAFLTGLFEASDPYGGLGPETPVRDLLTRGREQLADLEGSPEVRARLEHTLGAVHLTLGEYDEAEALFNSALERRRAIHGPDHSDVAESERRLADILSLRGSLDSAHVLLDHARRALIAGGDLDTLHQAELALQLGTIHHRRTDYPAAEKAYSEALTLYQAVLPDPDLRIARAQGNLAITLSAQRRLDEAEVFNRATVSSFERLPGDQAANLAQAYNNLGVTLERQGKLEEAEAVQRQALAEKRAYLPPGHASIGVTMTNLAGVLIRLDRLDEAETLLLDALALQRAAMGPDHRYVINALTDLAEVDTRRGDHDRALERLDEAHTLLLATVPPDNPRVATLLLRSGAVHRARGDFATGEALLARALAIREAAFGPDAAQTLAAGEALDALRDAAALAEHPLPSGNDELH